MKIDMLHFVPVFLVYFLTVTGPSVAHAEDEPNDTLDTACPIAVGQTMRGHLASEGDVDWYWLPVAVRGRLEIATLRAPEGVELVFRVADVHGNPVEVRLEPPGSGTVRVRIADLPGRGTYFVEVRSSRNRARSSEPYELALSFTAAKDEGEPNDMPETASLLPFGETVQASILPTGDADWYRLDVQRPGILRVAITPVPADLTMLSRVVDEDGGLLQKSGSSHGGASAGGRITLLTKGTYYLEVRDVDNEASSVQPYSVSVSLSHFAEEFRATAGHSVMKAAMGAFEQGDHAEAFRLFMKLAQSGNPNAQLMTGVMYLGSDAVPQDYGEAVKWIRKAADRGVAFAQYVLGNMYYRGKGVSQDSPAAYVWFVLASVDGYEKAIEDRDILAKQLTPAQIAEARNTAGQWQPISDTGSSRVNELPADLW